LSLGSPPGARAGRPSPGLALRPFLGWLLPIVAAAYLVRIAAAPSIFGIPYSLVILGPVAVFLMVSTAVVAIPVRNRLQVAVIGILVTLLTAGGAAALALTRFVRVPHLGLGFSALMTLAVLFGGGILAGAILAGRSGRRPSALAALVALTVVAMLATDIRLIGTLFNRDLLLYLRAGSALLNHQPVYVEAVLSQAPSDPTLLPFVYPPVSLPFLAVLAVLPRAVVELAWTVLAVAALVSALRLFGVRWPWVPVLLIWPPLLQGVWTGNASSFLLLLFALGPRVPSALVLPPLVKLQMGIDTLWLARERHWSSLARGLVAVAILVILTLPIVGIGAWQDWLRGLSAFAQTAANIRPIEGLALTRYVGPFIAIVLAVVVLAFALARRGLDSLATLGLASIATSPTLYLHGLTPALPALLRLRGAALWFALAMTASFIRGRDWWLVLGILVVAPLLPVVVDVGQTDQTVHPIGSPGILGGWSGSTHRDSDPSAPGFVPLSAFKRAASSVSKLARLPVSAPSTRSRSNRAETSGQISGPGLTGLPVLTRPAEPGMRTAPQTRACVD
jgi:hypothetical protein